MPLITQTEREREKGKLQTRVNILPDHGAWFAWTLKEESTTTSCVHQFSNICFFLNKNYIKKKREGGGVWEEEEDN